MKTRTVLCILCCMAGAFIGWFVPEWLYTQSVRVHASSVTPAIVPGLVPSGNKQGNSQKFQLAGTNSGTLGNPLCNDASGNATDSGCTGGGTSWYDRTGFDGGGVPLASNDQTCIYIPPAVTVTSVDLFSECANSTSCQGSASVAVTTGTLASYDSSGQAGIATAACTATLTNEYHHTTSCSATLAANSVMCFAGSTFVNSVRVKAYPH